MENNPESPVAEKLQRLLTRRWDDLWESERAELDEAITILQSVQAKPLAPYLAQAGETLTCYDSRPLALWCKYCRADLSVGASYEKPNLEQHKPGCAVRLLAHYMQLADNAKLKDEQ